MNCIETLEDLEKIIAECDRADPLDVKGTLSSVYLLLHGRIGHDFEWVRATGADRMPDAGSDTATKPQGG